MAEPKTPPQDPFEMFRRLWGPLGLPVPGMAMPTLDPNEIDKRVADLKSVEAWLAMNLNMVRYAVQGLEMQRSALQAMKSGTSEAAAGIAAAGANTAASTMMWPWAMMQQAMAANAPPPADAGTPDAKDKAKE